MEPQKMKKGLKLLTLLISSLLIAAVSAQIYSQMFMYSHVTVEGYYVKFAAAGNTTLCGGVVEPGGEEVTFSDMKGRNGSLVTYTEAVNITNGDSVSHNIELKLHEWDGDSQTTLRYINVTMYNEAGGPQGDTIHLVPGTGDVESSTSVSLPQSGMWRVQWDIFWWANATTTDTIDVTLVLVG